MEAALRAAAAPAGAPSPEVPRASPAPTPATSDHTLTVVPLETWAYHSPRLARDGIHADVGGLAEALVYYERALVNIQTPAELEALVARFAKEGAVDLLIRLFAEGTLRPYHFAFHSAPVGLPNGTWDLLNIQGQDQAEPRWFGRGVLARASLPPLPSTQRKQLLSVIEDHVVEFKADQYGGVIATSFADFTDPEGSILLVQALVDDVYDLLGFSEPPEVMAKVQRDGDTIRVTWNMDLRRFGEVLGRGFDAATPVSASIIATRHLWAAAAHGADIVMGAPLSRIAGAKLYEAASRAGRPQDIMDHLVAAVDFPDVRELVNHDGLPLSMVMTLRKKGARFRRWLQTEAERDRDALVAYLNETAKEAGWIKGARYTLSILSMPGGSLAGALTGAAIVSATGDPLMAAGIGSVAGATTKKLLESLSKAGQDWRPVMFGKWASASVEKYLKKKRTS